MSDKEDNEDETYEIEDFTHKRAVYQYIERQGPDVTPPRVLGHFMMHPSLYSDVKFMIDLTYN